MGSKANSKRKEKEFKFVTIIDSCILRVSGIVEREPSVAIPSPSVAPSLVIGENEMVPISSGRNSVRDLVGRTKTTFRTFQGSRRGGYTVNGPKLQPDFPHESIPLTSPAIEVEGLPPPVPRSPIPHMSDEEDSGDDQFPPPPSASLPDEFLSAQGSPVQVLAIRPFDDEEQAVAPPPFLDSGVPQTSPLSRSV